MTAIDLQIPRQAATLRNMVEGKVRAAILSGPRPSMIAPSPF